jgi:hypothetical protein
VRAEPQAACSDSTLLLSKEVEHKPQGVRLVRPRSRIPSSSLPAKLLSKGKTITQSRAPANYDLQRDQYGFRYRRA